jgi:hypothetical protein
MAGVKGAGSRLADMVATGVAALVVGGLLLSSGPLGDGGELPDEVGIAQREAGIPPVRVAVRGYLDAPLEPVAAGLDGYLHIPRPARRAGWWALGAAPGAEGGTVLLAGHVDGARRGSGVFARLWDVPVGTAVTVTGGDGGRHQYEITGRRRYRAENLPKDLFGGARGPRLALVTCIGSYDRRTRRYSDNLVLYGRPVTSQ